MITAETIRQATVDAVREALWEAYRDLKKEELAGFGLCTHDDVDSVYHVYATRDWVSQREPEYPEIGLISVEWTQQSNDGPFLLLSQMLSDSADADKSGPDADYERSRTERFRTLVEAMAICREEGLFDTKTLLSVSSTDPDASMERLACEAARQLNCEEVAAEYCKMMGC